MTPDKSFRKNFLEQGFAGPVPLFSRELCQEALQRLHNAKNPPVWAKAIALSNASLYQLATQPDILVFLKELLGEDILLWGSRAVYKRPGVEHPWHSDIECLDGSGQGLTLWIGLDKTNRDSSLHVISYSHTFGESLQEVACRTGKSRASVTTQEALRWAQERDPRSQLIQFDVRDGDALFLHRNLWHHSNNTSDQTRTALLLQYCTPDAEIRMPYHKEYEWPFRFSEERPPCVIVSGADHFGVNRIVPPPEPESIYPCVIQSIDSLNFKWRKEGWRSGSIFKAAPDSQKILTSHVSILAEGKTPHEPHIHTDEELLIVLSGEVDIIRTDSNGQNRSSERLKPGSFVYHAAHQSHTICSAGPGPAKYLMFKWKGEPQSGSEQQILQSGTFDIWTGKEKQRSGWKRIVNLQSPTSYLKKLNAHLSILEPGAGYPPHRDGYDVAILVLNGTVETLGHQIGRHGVIYYPANALHGMTNPGDEQAVYLVFEFHWN